jgi:hypothetical protein
MRVYFDKDGYVAGCMSSDVDNGCFMTENDIIVPLPQGMTFREFAAESHLYHLVDGVLVKDGERAIAKPVAKPTTEERLAALETALLEMMGVVVND